MIITVHILLNANDVLDTVQQFSDICTPDYVDWIVLWIDNMLLRIIMCFSSDCHFVFDRLLPDNDGLVHACVMCATYVLLWF